MTEQLDREVNLADVRDRVPAKRLHDGRTNTAQTKIALSNLSNRNFRLDDGPCHATHLLQL